MKIRATTRGTANAARPKRARGRPGHVVRARTLPLDLGFLCAGGYDMPVWRDGPNADRDAQDLRRETRAVVRGDRLTFTPGGGSAARIRPRVAAAAPVPAR